MGVIGFEKDEDGNGHIDYVESVANLRAVNYSIQNISGMEVKQIAGKIIPALATTTSLIVSHVMLQIMQFAFNQKG